MSEVLDVMAYKGRLFFGYELLTIFIEYANQAR
jgi:hypothetical protein